MTKLILLRHGQSEWNKQNIFTGWIDIPLSEEGVAEALEAGKTIASLPIDIIFTSTLSRAIMTALLAMQHHSSNKVPVILHPEEGKLEEWGECHNPRSKASLIPVFRAWELNERMYGELQGMNKQEMRDRYGAEQVQRWRRSYDSAPPGGESLAMTASRTLPFFDKTVMPSLRAEKNVLISAHGNSLRAIVMELDGLSSEEVINLEIPTGKALIYDYADEKLVKVP